MVCGGVLVLVGNILTGECYFNNDMGVGNLMFVGAGVLIKVGECSRRRRRRGQGRGYKGCQSDWVLIVVQGGYDNHDHH